MTRFAVATWCSPLSTPADLAGAVLAVAANRFLFNNEARASAPRLVVLRARKARRQIRFSASTGRLMQTMIPEIPQRGSHKNEQSPRLSMNRLGLKTENLSLVTGNLSWAI